MLITSGRRTDLSFPVDEKKQEKEDEDSSHIKIKLSLLTLHFHMITKTRKGIPDKQAYRTIAMRGKLALHTSRVPGIGQDPTYISDCSESSREITHPVLERRTLWPERLVPVSLPQQQGWRQNPVGVPFHPPLNPAQGQSPALGQFSLKSSIRA